MIRPPEWADRFTVPGRIVPWARTRTNKGGKRYKPRGQRAYQDAVALYARDAGLTKRAGPVGVHIDAYWPSAKKPRMRSPHPVAWRPHVPDVDNVAKVILDALNGVAYDDDAQVVEIAARKLYAAQGEPPRVVVWVYRAAGTQRE